MQTAASLPDSDWLDICSRLPPGLDLDALALETRAIRRKRGISEAEDLLRLALVRGPGGKSLKETALWAHMNGVAEISAPSLAARLHGSVAFLAALTGLLLAHGRPARPCVWRDRCLHLCDASSLSQRGSKGTDWRIHATYDLAGGRFSHLELTGAKGAEALRRATCPEGGVMIADRGYAKAGEMATFRLSRGGLPRDFIVRTGWNMLRLETPKGDPFDLIDALREMEQTPCPENAPGEWAVEALYGRHKNTKRLPIRLIVKPLPPEQAELARAKVRRASNKRQNKVDPRSELAAGFMMLATSLPADIPADEICAVYRLRWQIELAFKRLKSLLHIDRIPTSTEKGGLSWLYPHLILALLTDDICQEILESPPCGPCCRRYRPAVPVGGPGRCHRPVARHSGATQLYRRGPDPQQAGTPAHRRGQTKAEKSQNTSGDPLS